MKPFEFIDFAQQLAVQSTITPAILRSITSRAYYGAFHLAKALVAKCAGQLSNKHDAHVWLLACQVDDLHQASRLLADLNNARIKADYQLDDASAESINFARRNVERAVEFQALPREVRIAAACRSDNSPRLASEQN